MFADLHVHSCFSDGTNTPLSCLPLPAKTACPPSPYPTMTPWTA